MMADRKRDEKRVYRTRGFQRASKLVSQRIQTAGESRGFSVTRLLTHWSDIVGPDISQVTRPVNVSYGRGFGATLTLLTSGSSAPMIEMQKEAIRQKVNACYGYAAIQTVRLTQTASSGFSEGRPEFGKPSKPRGEQDVAIRQAASHATEGVSNDDLRSALERLGANILSREKQ